MSKKSDEGMATFIFASISLMQTFRNQRRQVYRNPNLRRLQSLRENLSASSIKAEVPFSTMTVDGGVCTGIIDLLVETPNGLWVIDHKSDRFTDEGAILGNYWPQLLAYQEALLELDLQVAGVGLNLVNEGKLLLARLWVEP